MQARTRGVSHRGSDTRAPLAQHNAPRPARGRHTTNEQTKLRWMTQDERDGGPNTHIFTETEMDRSKADEKWRARDQVGVSLSANMSPGGVQGGELRPARPPPVCGRARGWGGRGNGRGEKRAGGGWARRGDHGNNGANRIDPQARILPRPALQRPHHACIVGPLAHLQRTLGVLAQQRTLGVLEHHACIVGPLANLRPKRPAL